MKLVFSRRALSDLDQIAKYYNDYAGRAVAQSIGQRIEDVMTRITTPPNPLRACCSDLTFASQALSHIRSRYSIASTVRG